MTDTTQTPPDTTTPAKPEPQPHQSPEFIAQVQAWIKDEKAPSGPHSADVIAKLKEVVAKQDTINQRGKDLETQIKGAQAEAVHLAGKIDALLGVLHSLEESADA